MEKRTKQKVNEIQRNLFYQMPKFLFAKEFENLSNNAKILYMLLKDRNELSIKNNWIDNDGYIFLMMKRTEITETLNLSKNTTCKTINELKKAELISEIKQGQGKTNKIYLLTTIEEEKTNEKTKNNRTQYNINEIQRNLFYQMPKFLFTKEFEKLNNNAKILYMLLKDRNNLSIKNNWIDNKGNIFFFFKRLEMASMLNISEDTITKEIKELKKYNLINEKKQNQGKPNIMYLLATNENENFQNPKFTGSENQNPKFTGSRIPNLRGLESQNLGANNNYINKTDLTTTKTVDVDKQQNLIYEAFKSVEYDITKAKINKLLKLSNSDAEKVITLIKIMKKQKSIKNIYGWIIAGLKNFDDYTQKNNYQKKSKLNNFDSENINYEDIERKEQEYMYKIFMNTIEKENQPIKTQLID